MKAACYQQAAFLFSAENHIELSSVMVTLSVRSVNPGVAAMNDADDPECFLYEMPVWVLIKNDTGGLLAGACKSGEMSSPIFTDEDLALRFSESYPVLTDGYIPRAIPDSKALLRYLCELEIIGFNHVTFDQRSRTKGRACSIKWMRQEILRKRNTGSA